MALTRRARKRLLFLGLLLAGAGLMAAGYHLVIIPRREYRARVALEQAQKAYEANDYEGVLKTVGVYLGRHRHDGEALYMTADAHLQVSLACAARGDGEGRIKNYRGARDYAMAARAALGNDPRPLELLLTLHSTFREIAEVEEIASILGPSSQRGMEANVHAALWAGNHEEALRRAEAYVAAWPDAAAAHSLRQRCMIDAGRDLETVRATAVAASDRHPDRADFAVLYARAAVALAAAQASDPVLAEQHLRTAADSLKRVADAVPTDGDTFAEYLILVDQLLSNRSMTGEQRNELATQRQQVIETLLTRPEHRQWAAANAAAWAWSRTGRTADALPFIERVSDITDADATVPLLGWRGACAEAGQRRAQVIAALSTSDTAMGRLWFYTLKAIEARLAGNLAEYEQNLEKATAVVEASAAWLPFFEMERAASLVMKNDRAGAIRRLRDIVERAPPLIAPRLALYHHLLYDNRTEDALEQAGLIRHLRVDDGESMYLWTIAAIAAAERGTPVAIEVYLVEWLRRQAALTVSRPERPQGWENFATLAVRCHLIRGEREEASAILVDLGEAKISLEPTFFVALLEACQRHKLDDLAARVAEVNEGPDTAEARLSRAQTLARSEGVKEAEARLREQVRTASPEEVLDARLALISFLDQRDLEATRVALEELLREHSDVRGALIHALSTVAIWTDREMVNRAMAQLKKFGDDEAAYRIFNANRFIVFEYDPAGAADHIQSINAILKTDPGNVRALRMMAVLLLKTADGVPNAAINYMQQAAQLGHTESKFDVVDLLLDAGKPEEARRAAEVLRDIPHPTPAIFRARAGLWVRLGMLQQAERDLAALGDDATPRDAVDRALLLFDLGKRDQAQQLIGQLLQHGIDDPEVARRAAGLCAMAGDPAAGRRILDDLVNASGDPAARLALADYLMRFGQAAEAASMYDQIVRGDKNAGPEMWLRLADCHVRAGRPELATQALAGAPDAPVIQAARTLCSREATGPAPLHVLSRWLGALTEPTTRNAALTLADALNDERALVAFTSANRAFLLGWLELADWRAQHEDGAGAIQALRSAVAHVPVDPLPAMLLTTTLVDAGQWNEAAIAIDEWRKREGDSYDLHIQAAMIADHRQNWDVVVKLLDQHRQRLIDNPDPPYVALLATGLAASGRGDEAHELLWPLVEARRVAPAVYASVAARAHDGMRLRQLQQWTGRVEPLLPAQDRTLISLKFALALAHDQAGDVAAAEPLYRAVLASDSRELRPSAANNLAEILRRERRDLEEAVALAQSAVEAAQAVKESLPIVPSHMQEFMAASMDTLGLCQLASGRVHDAVATFEKAFAESPQKLNIRAGLIVSLEKAGRQEDADRYLSDGVRRLGPSLEARVNELRIEYGVKKAAAAGTP